MEQVTDGSVTGSLEVDLLTIMIGGIQYFQGMNKKQGNLLLDTITSETSTASYLFKYNGEESIIHSIDIPSLGRVLTTLLGR